MYAITRLILGITFLGLGLLACSSSSSGDDKGSNNAELQAKCDDMCNGLIAPPLSGCGSSDASSFEACRAECFEHVTPKPDGELEATEADLDCAIAAQDCTTWENCGDLL